MKLSGVATLFLTVGLVAAGPITRRKLVLRNGPQCAVDGGRGVCMSTSAGCPGGSFHQGHADQAACAGGDEVQCCIVGGSGTVRDRAAAAQPATPSPPPGSGPLPGLDSTQSAHGWDIIGEVKSAGVGKQGCLAAFATALVESSVLVYANNAVPASLNYPHDKIGSDHDSIGIFQQRASVYPNIAADMSPAQSAGQFFQVMKGISGWQTMDVGTLCQDVQKSAYPSRYSAQVGAATKICAAGGFS